MEIRGQVRLLARDEEACRALIQRIAASQSFHRSTRIRELLLHLAERSLLGQGDDLSEVRIAEEVFQRPDYNPVEDNLVRASARQLRLKLKEYFETEGLNETWCVEVPKGSYVVHFQPRKKEDPLPEPPPRLAEPEISQTVSALPSPAPNRAAGLNRILLLIALGSLASAIFFGVQNRTLRSAINPEPHTLLNTLLSNPHRPTDIVVIDSALVLYEGLLGENVGVEEYADRSYMSSRRLPPGVSRGEFGALLGTRQITNFADVEIVASIARLYPTRTLRIRHTRNMNARDFSSDDNFILLGSSVANPWTRLFEAGLNFEFESHPESWPCIRNRNPQAGEEASYGRTSSRDETGPQFARIAVVHNGSGPGRVALIAGTSMEGTEAAGKSFLDPQFTEEALKIFGVRHADDLPDFELIVRTQGVGGTGRGAQIVAHRLVPPPHRLAGR